MAEPIFAEPFGPGGSNKRLLIAFRTARDGHLLSHRSPDNPRSILRRARGATQDRRAVKSRERSDGVLGYDPNLGGAMRVVVGDNCAHLLNARFLGFPHRGRLPASLVAEE